jgi:hypothetical protein
MRAVGTSEDRIWREIENQRVVPRSMRFRAGRYPPASLLPTHPLTRNHDVEQSNSSKIPFYKGKSANAPFQAFTTAGISEEVSARRRHPVGAAELIAG